MGLHPALVVIGITPIKRLTDPLGQVLVIVLDLNLELRLQFPYEASYPYSYA